ncbi:MAG: transcription antitermination protein NusB, partial [Planctomycetaceae bacterium]|nr:transcription antitermination protein NusB [Planctomycetaceae bacterium]
MTDSSDSPRRRDRFRRRPGKPRPGRKRGRSPYKPAKRVDSARHLAWQALSAYERRTTFVGQTLNQLFQTQSPDPSERRLATELACGSVRRRLLLDAVLAAYSSRPIENLDFAVRLVLRIGIDQILFVDRIPPHAAVAETVNLCRTVGKEEAAGFVNGILRTLLRELPHASK